MADVVGSAAFELRATRQQMKKDLDEAKRDLGGFVNDAEREAGGSTSRLGGMMGKLGLAVGALTGVLAAGIALAVKFGGASLQMADTLADSAQRIGIGTEALQEYQYVARKTGEDANAVGGDLEAFSNKLAKAQAGLSKSDANAFAALFGKDFDLKQLTDVGKALELTTDRIEELTRPSDRAAIAEQLGLQSLATALREGSGEVARLRDEARELGFVLDDALIQKGAQAQEQLEDLSQIIGIQMAEAFIGLSGEVMAFTSYIADALRGLNDFLGKFEEWKNKTNAMYGDNFVGDLVSGNAGKAFRSASESVASGRTMNAIGVVRNGGDIAGATPSLADMEAFARAPAGPRTRSALSGRTNLTPVQPRGRADNSAEKARRAAEQEARRAERVEEEIARARIRVLGIVDDEAQTVQQRFDTAKAQVEAEREAEAKNLESRKARKDINQAEFDQLTLINTQTAALEDRVANDILARDLADERLAKERLLSDLTADLLVLQSGAARTAEERRKIELQLLAMAQKKAREDMLKDPDFLKLDPDGQRNAIGRQDQVFRGQAEAVARNNLSPLDAWRDASLQSIGQVNEAYENIAARGLDALNDGIVDAIMNSKSLGEVFSNVAKSILADLLQIHVRQSITEPLANVLFGGGKKSGNGGISDVIGNFIKGKIPGFATGVTDFGGGLARVHAGELLVNLPKGTDVITAAAAKGMTGGAGGQSFTYSPTVHAPGASAEAVARLGKIMEEQQRNFAKNVRATVNRDMATSRIGTPKWA